MPPAFHNLLLFFFFYLLLAATTTSSTRVGVTYDPSYATDLPPPERVANTLHSLGVSIVRLLHPSPNAIRAFSYSNTSLLLSVPNSFVYAFAANRSAASLWLYTNVLPFYPRSRISMISVGDDVISSPSDNYFSDPSTTLIPAMRNLRFALGEFGIKQIAVSTTFSFDKIMSMTFPPSSADFQRPIFDVIINPLLDFLDESNSSLLVNIYPYHVYRVKTEIPISYVLFQEHPFNFRDDVITGVRYRNLFDVMVDSIVAALAISGHENIPLIVTETGWPSSAVSSRISNNAGIAEATVAYAELYVRGLTNHLKSGMGTPLKREAMSEVYIYQLFDGGTENMTEGNGVSKTLLQWGFMHPNMTMKFNIDFSGSQSVFWNKGIFLVVLMAWFIGSI